MTSPPVTNGRVLISWDGSGSFTGPHDDVTERVASDPGVTIDEGRDGAQSLAPPKISAGELELFNHDGRYSQHRADSPVYQRVLPGRPVAFRVGLGDRRPWRGHQAWRGPQPWRGQADYAFSRQIVDEISQTVGWGQQRVKLTTIGQSVVLTDSLVTIPLQASIRTDQCVTLLLDAVGWPDDRRTIAVSDTTLSYWWCDERRPWDALLELLGAEGPGTFYVDRNGHFTWENRNYRTITPRSTTSQATFRDRRTDDGLWFAALSYDPGYKTVLNEATYATRRRALGALAPVWSYGAPLSLAAGQRQTLIARPSDPFLGAVTPALGTDYALSAGSATVTLTQASGFAAYIEVLAGGAGATIVGVGSSSGLQLRAQPLMVVSETTVKNTIDASASIATYSPVPGAAVPIAMTVSGWPELEPAAAQAVCDAWVSRYQVPRATVSIVVRNVDEVHLRQILERMPSDRVTLVEANTGLADDAWVNALELRVFGAGGRQVALTLGCELCDTLSGAVWDTAIWNDPLAVWGI